jgi:pseudouridine-5'-phosphate glycosidase
VHNENKRAVWDLGCAIISTALQGIVFWSNLGLIVGVHGLEGSFDLEADLEDLGVS